MNGLFVVESAEPVVEDVQANNEKNDASEVYSDESKDNVTKEVVENSAEEEITVDASDEIKEDNKNEE